MKSNNKLKKVKVTILTLNLLLIFFQSNSYPQNTKSAENKQSENQEDIIRVDTNLVTVPVSILDREGRYVANLKKEDFQIFEDNIEQEIALFEQIEHPFTALLLLDVSGSMINHLADLTKAVNAFVKQLRPDDQIVVVVFGEEVKMLIKPTKIKDLKKSIKLEVMATYTNTMVYDAVEFAQKKMKKISGRKAIILFSDGVGSGFSASAKSNQRDAEEQEELIYTMQFAFSPIINKHYKMDEDLVTKLVTKANVYMKDLATKTGGRHYEIDKIINVNEVFQAIANELKQQYNLGYYPKQLEKGEKKQVRQIKVKIRQPNLAVRARESYVIGQKK